MITKNEQPCVEVTCDKCGEGDNVEYGGSFHYASVEEAVEQLRYQEWEVFIDPGTGEVAKVFCFGCWEEMTQEERDEATP